MGKIPWTIIPLAFWVITACGAHTVTKSTIADNPLAANQDPASHSLQGGAPLMDLQTLILEGERDGYRGAVYAQENSNRTHVSKKKFTKPKEQTAYSPNEKILRHSEPTKM